MNPADVSKTRGPSEGAGDRGSDQGSDHASPPGPTSGSRSGSEPLHPTRRRFLFALGASAAGAATVASVGRPPTPAASAPDGATLDERGSRGYHLSDHVKKYYATARIF